MKIKKSSENGKLKPYHKLIYKSNDKRTLKNLRMNLINTVMEIKE